jgi:hypothetical protein
VKTSSATTMEAAPTAMPAASVLREYRKRREAKQNYQCQCGTDRKWIAHVRGLPAHFIRIADEFMRELALPYSI